MAAAAVRAGFAVEEDVDEAGRGRALLRLETRDRAQDEAEFRLHFGPDVGESLAKMLAMHGSLEREKASDGHTQFEDAHRCNP